MSPAEPFWFPMSSRVPCTVTGTYPAENLDPSVGPTTPVSIQDDGQGKLIGSGASGTINYMTGKLDVTLINEVDTGSTATFTVNYSRLGQSSIDMPESLQSRKTPKINYDSVKGQFALTWVESRIDTSGSNYGNSYASVLCFGVAPVTWLTGDSTFLGYLYLDPALTPLANPLAIASADAMRSETTSSMKLVSSSRTATLETYVYDFFTNLNNPNLASDSTSPETLFVWEGERNKATLSCSLDAATGTITSTFVTALKDDGNQHIYGIFDKEIILNTATKWLDFGNTGSGTNPSLAIDSVSSPRKFLVAWEDMRGGSNTKIFGQLIYSGGGLYNSNRMLSYQDSAGSGSNDAVITNSRQTRPVVSYDAVNQRYFVMWQDERNSSTSVANIDLYGQYVNLEGSLSGANYAISSNSSNQLAPAIAYDSFTKHFFAVWKDARNINPPGTSASDIYGQLFSIGQPQMTLLTTTTPTEQLVPAVHDFKTTTGTWTFLVKNTGDQDLTIDPIASTNLPSPPFSIAPSNGAVLAPGSSITYAVTYIPTSSGVYNDSFTLTSDGGSQKVALSATGNVSAAFSFSPADKTEITGSTNEAFSQKMSVVGGYAPFTWSATGLAGSGLTFNTVTGEISGATPITGTYTVAVTVSDSSAPTVSITNTYTIVISSVKISTTTLVPWTQWVSTASTPSSLYSQQLTATGGSSLTYTWTYSGTLPAGLTLSSSGLLSGNPTDIGNHIFNIIATNPTDATQQSPPKAFTVVINPPPSILTTTLPHGTQGTAYSQLLSMTGGTEPAWSVLSGLPAGLVFNTLSCPNTICGTPTNTGTYPLTLVVTDKTGARDSKSVSLVIDPVGTTPTTPPVTSTSPPTTSNSGGASGCFIATAAYGSYLEPHVMVLRHFRDEVLLQSVAGTAFVKFYYRYSPPIADYIAEHAILRMMMRVALTPLIFVVKYPLLSALLSAFSALWFIRRRLTAKGQTEMVQQAG